MAVFETDLFGEPVVPERQGSRLAETWDYPPFTVLNAREGWWQERKRQWLALGIRSEVGRGAGGGMAFDVKHGLETFQRGKAAANAAPIGGGLAARLANRGSDGGG